MITETVLTATLRDWRRSRFAWGSADCLMSVCTYVLALTGVDPAAPWRGTYHDEAGAMAILRGGGGGLALLARNLPPAGMAMVNTPQRGDVICARFGEMEIAGLCLGNFCAFRMERGVVELRTSFVEIIGAWRPCVD